MKEKDERYYQAYLKHNKISRRGLLRGIFPQEQLSASGSTKRQIARPPFSCAEHIFISHCNGCGNCSQACPYGLIHIENQLARLNIDYSACDFCAQCAIACPTNVLHPSFKADTQLRPSFQANCLKQQNQSCNTCQLACPQQAISADLSVNHEKCNGCGECKLACFVCAIKLVLN